MPPATVAVLVERTIETAHAICGRRVKQFDDVWNERQDLREYRQWCVASDCGPSRSRGSAAQEV